MTEPVACEWCGRISEVPAWTDRVPYYCTELCHMWDMEFLSMLGDSNAYVRHFLKGDRVAKR